MARNARHLNRMVDDILAAAISGTTEDYRRPPRPGIAPEDLDRVFVRFQRSSTAVRSGIPGTGRRLAVAQEVAEQHGGELRVTSELGVGSVFTLRLPLRQD